MDKFNHYFDSIKYRIWKIFKFIRDVKRRRDFSNSEITLISMNCTGGILYHDLRQQFMSPTINMFFTAEDFVRFCEKLEYYLSVKKLQPDIVQSIRRGYPIAKLDDITLHFMHYKSLEDAQKKWNERKKRINNRKIVILGSDRDGMDENLLLRLAKLPYKKMIFVHKKIDIEGCIYISGYDNDSQVGIITDHKGWLGKRPIDQFDWIGYLNEV